MNARDRNPSAASPAVQGDDFAESFGRHLAHENVLDPQNIDRARRAATSTGERFDHVLAKLGLLPENVLIEALARHLRIEIATARDIPPEAVLPTIIRPDFIRARKVLPIASDPEQLTVAVVDPLDDEPLRALAYLTGLRIRACLVSADQFQRSVRLLYGDKKAEDASQADARIDEASETDVQRLRDIANEAPVIRLVNEFISAAVDAKASDVHIEPGIDGVAVRYRVDGHLLQARMLSSGLRAAVTSRIKIMAKLDIAERRMPQDGRIKIPVRGIDIDFRVSTIPTVYGESVVMRILDRSRVELDFVKLGFDADRIRLLDDLMNLPNGIVLVTGPTGSGKTTTLYTALTQLNRPNVKVFTVEDPVEYQIAGINQVQVHAAIGLDFPHSLRSILRQDPDIVMIGEIRDLETARIAIQASLTGHLVFSTLHTNSAAATISRLIDMGVENYLLASTVNGILAQRLVRRLCPQCAAPHVSADVWRPRIVREIGGGDAGRDLRILQPVGCDACGGSGFSGRIAIAELMKIDKEARDCILSRSSDAQLENVARRGGMRTMYEDGLHKVGMGHTTIEEVLRATRMDR